MAQKKKASECMFYDPKNVCNMGGCKVLLECNCQGCSTYRSKRIAIESAENAVRIYMRNHGCSMEDAKRATLYYKQIDAIEAAYGTVNHH